ncbi:MAG: hypothetical protein AB1894_22890 [Chloroflexota bacterium]
MRCPKCAHSPFSPVEACPACGFQGDAQALETLFHVDFLLDELQTWSFPQESFQQEIQERYARQRRALEVSLGLRPPPLEAEAASQARMQIAVRHTLLSNLPQWVKAGVLDAEAAAAFRKQAQDEIEALQESLGDAPVTPAPAPSRQSLEAGRYLSAILDELEKQGRVHNPKVYADLRLRLATRLESLEVALGLRAAPLPETTLAAAPPGAPPSAPASAAPVRRPPRPPLTWERVVDTLLSERTMHAMLFLGAGLLFAAAVSLVVWNWQAFPPWLQVLFLAVFTGIFYGLGWYVRVRMKLRNGGVALSAVASMLVPLDFYAFYLSGGFPADLWAQVWLLASVTCLCAYLATALLVQAEFFVYLVGLAAGSSLAAGLQVVGVSQDVWQAALVALALVLALAGEFVRRRAEEESSRAALFAAPLWRLALLGAGTIALLSLGRWLGGFAAGTPYQAALALDWWLAGILFCLALGAGPAPLRGRTVGLAAVSSFPVAALITQDLILSQRGLPAAWHALGLALLGWLYLEAGRWLVRRSGPALPRYLGRTFAGAGVFLVLVSAGWALGLGDAMAVVHPLLSVAVLFNAWTWRRPGLVYFGSLLLLSGSTALGGGQQATLAQLGIVWAFLAIVQVSGSILIRRRVGAARLQGVELPGFLYAVHLANAGWLTAGLALLPPLFSFEQNVLTYVLGNWMALNGWLALLAHERGSWGMSFLLYRRRAGAQVLDSLARRRLEAKTALVYHWSAALPLIVWLGLAWAGWDWAQAEPSEARLGLAYLALAWISLLVGAWLRRSRRVYARPWIVASHLSAAIGILVGLWDYNQPWMAATLGLAAGFYFAASWVQHRRGWLLPGGVAFPLGWLLALDWLNVRWEALPIALALVPLAYLLAASLIERRRLTRRAFLAPLYFLVEGIGLAAFIWSLAQVAQTERPSLLWAAAANLLLALGMGWLAWLFKRGRNAHLAAWLGVVAGGLVALEFSRGSGRSALLAALLAVAYIGVERGLLYFGRGGLGRGAWRATARRAWRLFGQPFYLAGWAISAGAILLALVRNLVLLEGTTTRLNWSIASTLTTFGLYAGAAYLYRLRKGASQRLAWVAACFLFVPWNLVTLRIWHARHFEVTGYGLSWVLLALVELLVGAGLYARLGVGERRLGQPACAVAQILMPVGLLWGTPDVDVSSLTFGLGLIFYLLAVLLQLRQGASRGPATSRRHPENHLYMALLVAFIWAAYLLARFQPEASRSAYGGLMLALSVGSLAVGWQVAHMPPERKRGFGGLPFARPLYLATYVGLAVGTALMAHQRTALLAALLVDTLVLAISTGLFRQPLWIYPASATLSGAVLVALAEWNVPPERFGWAWIALGGIYLGVARGLRQGPAARWDYASPILATAFALIALGLPLSSQERVGAIVGYGAAALLYALAARWLKQPLLGWPVVGLAAVPYWLGMLELGVARRDLGLALWPGILLGLGLAVLVDRRWGVQPDAGGEPGLPVFPWDDLFDWPRALAARLMRWWAFPLYTGIYLGAAVGAAFSLGNASRLALSLALACGLYAQATYRFRLRGWLFAAAGSAQLAILAGLSWWGQAAGRHPGMWIALAFTPVSWITALAGLAVQRRLGEGAPFGEAVQQDDGKFASRIRRSPPWSRPLYLLLLADMLALNLSALQASAESAWVLLLHALLLGVLASAWISSGLVYLGMILGLLALVQGLFWAGAAATIWPWALALLALGYGLPGYLSRVVIERQWAGDWQRYLQVWERPLQRGGWLLSWLSLALALLTGPNVIVWGARAIFALPVLNPPDLERVGMLVSVLALLGLFYLAAALVERRRWLGYGAVAMLLAAWCLEWSLVWGQREVQWYAVPAGIYLLGVGYLEWTAGGKGSRALARWIDRAAILLLLGSSFWQSLGPEGGRYALLMGVEGLLLLWWGSARRLRRFLYAGVGGVTLDVAGQLIEPLLSANRWIVFGVAGALLIGLAIFIERRLEQVMALSREVRQRLEKWE